MILIDVLNDTTEKNIILKRHQKYQKILICIQNLMPLIKEFFSILYHFKINWKFKS